MTLGQVSPVDSIGNISEYSGYTRVVRDKPYESVVGFDLNSMDRLETAKGRMGVLFVDDTRISLTANSTVVLDEFVYDPNQTENSQMALNFIKGTGRFISSKTKKIRNDKIKIRAGNAATVGIRGTDFTLTVDEGTGKVICILLPDENGLSSGEIIVTTALGSVTLNRPYQSTIVYNFETAPSQPVILDLDLSMIDNLLLVNPPQEVQENTEESSSSTDSILDVDFLEFDDLDTNELQEDSLEYQELDIDYLAADFLQDLLDVIQEVDQLSKSQLNNQGLEGTSIGYDSDTQISSFVTESEVKLIREVEHKFKIDLSKDQSSAVTINQSGKINTVTINGGTDSIINIKQGS